MPKTILGKWSVGLIGSFIIWMAALFILISSGQRGGEGFFDNLYLTIPGLLSGLSGIAAFIIGLIAIIKQRERAILVFISSFIGFLIFLFILAEVAFPH